MKEVLLISRSTLLGTLPEAAGKYALKWFQKRNNIKVLLNDEITGMPYSNDNNSTTLKYNTLSGRIIEGDVFIDCTGRYVRIEPPTSTELLQGTTTAMITDTETEKSIKSDISTIEPLAISVGDEGNNEVLEINAVIDSTCNEKENSKKNDLLDEKLNERHFVWPYAENGLIAVDEHLMVR